jgi:DNA-binding transcriptional LysR family regulator
MNPNMSRLTLDALQLVDAIARQGSFAAAAAELGRVPSAVTYAARKLEEEIDVLLFNRRGYRARLTPAGEELLKEGRLLLAAVDDLTRRVQRVAAGWERELRIAIDSVISFERVVPMLGLFCEAAPTQVRTSTEVLGGTWDALITGRADLAIGASQEGPEPSRLGPSYRFERMGALEFVFAVAPGHPLAAMPSPLKSSELRRHRQIVVADSSLRLAPRDSGLLGVQDTLTVSTIGQKIAAQKAGLGCGFLPVHRIRNELDRGELIAKETDQGRRESALHYAWRTDARGKALDWWLAALRNSETRAALTA